MTPKERAAMQQALEALENLPALSWIPEKERDAFEAITALREALAERKVLTMTQEEMVDAIRSTKIEEPVAWGMKASNGAFFTITPDEHDNNGEGLHNIPLYAAPVRTKDLTYAELGELFVKAKEETFGYARVKPEGGISLHPSIEYFARAVIAADRELNK